MRYQFFLDARDYIKYALLDDLMAQLEPGQLSLIWMLTSDVGNTHGNRHPRFDASRPALNAFFERDPRPNLWDVSDYFNRRGYICNSYGDQPEDFFTATNRAEYFKSIPTNLLKNALVFLDPDNGVEPRTGPKTSHVRLAELQGLWNRLSGESVLVIYQHKPRVAAAEYWPDVSRRVGDAIGNEVLALPFGDVGFLLASQRNLREVLRREGHQLHEVLN
jgi:hypothetical protein